jgi:ABC-type Na+ efflux pump permease subunit
MAIQMQEGLRTAPDDLLNVRPIWTPTKESSDASKADYYTKIASVNASFADSDVGLMKAGLNFDEIKALRKAQQQQRSQDRIEQLKTQTTTRSQNPQSLTKETSDGSERPASDSGQTQGAAAATGQGA